MRQLSIAIVGASYPNKGKGPTRRFGISLCEPGTPLALVPEPKNRHDEHAIAVYGPQDIQLGYLPSERAVYIGKMMREGHEVAAVFHYPTDFGGWMRVAFDGDVPALPPVSREPEQDDSGFFPDPEYEE